MQILYVFFWFVFYISNLVLGNNYYKLHKDTIYCCTFVLHDNRWHRSG